MTKLFQCNCKNTYQDGLYGISMRVCNEKEGKRTQQSNTYACTVCGSLKVTIKGDK